MNLTEINWEPFRKEFPIIFGIVTPMNLSAGEGWFYLLWDLCASLEVIARQRVEAGSPPMRIRQVKEKFGGLRCYLQDAPDEARALTWAASIRAETICEACGNVANYCVSKSGWWKAFCPIHQVKFNYSARH
jgi:hypothetical protein